MFTRLGIVYFMDVFSCDIMKIIKEKSYHNQRYLSDISGHSLGTVNQCIKKLTADGYLDGRKELTAKANALFRRSHPDSAILLAAGPGIRMAPVSHSTPKALLKVKNEVLIERLIRQLHDANVHHIYIVVGFLKEQFEYLIDDFDVKLIVNPEYGQSNTLHSLSLASDHLSNTYIVPADLYFAENPFSQYELYSWYMMADRHAHNSFLRIGKNYELQFTNKNTNTMIGLCYIKKENAKYLALKLADLDACPQSKNAFWEIIFQEKDCFPIAARIACETSVVEINTYKQLQEINCSYSERKQEAIAAAAQFLNCPAADIEEICCLKDGITNHSYLLNHKGNKYVLRIPSINAPIKIDRQEEQRVYQTIKSSNLADSVIYMDPVKGIKLSLYLSDTHTCQIDRPDEVYACMTALKRIHQSGLIFKRSFDIWDEIEKYEQLRGSSSVYPDYDSVKDSIQKLRPYLQTSKENCVPCHLDVSAENFLISDFDIKNIHLIDWERGAMCDSAADIAVFAVNSALSHKQINQLIDFYYQQQATQEERIRIYAWIAAIGLLFSNWCELCLKCGIEFGYYSICQYRYAKEYASIVLKKKEH